MYTKIARQSIVSMFVVVSLLIFGSSASLAHAELISNQQVEEQKKEVMLGIIEVLQEDVKLLQMLLIQKLEARVAYLQTLQSNR